jgi:hypothetical protein
MRNEKQMVSPKVQTCCDARYAMVSNRELAEREGSLLPTPPPAGRLDELLARPDLADFLRRILEGAAQ